MSKVVCDITVTVDGYVAGPNQTLEEPFGEGLGAGEELHRWMFETPDENKAEREAILASGAFIMGRNMFGPIRGAWTGDWRGWWGENPPFHAPVFVLTHHPREQVTMDGGTTYTFVTTGIESALERAKAAAGDKDVTMSGANVAQQYLKAGLLDEIKLSLVPVLLGSGKRLFDHLGGEHIRLEPVQVLDTPSVTHLRYRVVK